LTARAWQLLAPIIGTPEATGDPRQDEYREGGRMQAFSKRHQLDLTNQRPNHQTSPVILLFAPILSKIC
jgi:hypothetical protein